MKLAASKSPFAQRMMEREMPETLSAGPDARFFTDPPEMIGQAFGGREWFFDTGCTRLHRVGLFGGLGWELDKVLAQQQPRGITGVQIRICPSTRDFSIYFVNRRLMEDHLGPDPLSTKVIDYRPGLQLSDLKRVYLEVIGEYVDV